MIRTKNKSCQKNISQINIALKAMTLRERWDKNENFCCSFYDAMYLWGEMKYQGII